MDEQTSSPPARRGGFGDRDRRVRLRRIAGRSIAALAAVAALLYGLRNHVDSDTWQPWWSEAAYVEKQQALGYRVYGRIEGPMRWPAIAVSRVDAAAPGGIRFTAPSGQPHVYQNFPETVQFKAVTFAPTKSGARRFVMVLGRQTKGD